MQEPPGLKPDWFVEIWWLAMKKPNILLNKICSNVFPHIGRTEIELQFTRDCLYFLWTGTKFAVYHSSGKIPFSKYDLKIVWSGLHIDGPHLRFGCVFYHDHVLSLN